MVLAFVAPVIIAVYTRGTDECTGIRIHPDVYKRQASGFGYILRPELRRVRAGRDYGTICKTL